MQSLVHLYNTALAKLGGEQIPLNISPIEDDALGAICRNIFPHVLDTALEAHAWGFAGKRAPLARLPGRRPDSRAYRFRYALPADCVRPLRVVPPEKGSVCRPDALPCWVLEGTCLLCDVEEPGLLYVARVSEPRQWPAYFTEILVWGMAAELAASRNNDRQQAGLCAQRYEHALARGCARDRAMNNERGKRSEWSRARFGG